MIIPSPRRLTRHLRLALIACVTIALLAGSALAFGYPEAEKDFLAHDTGGQAVYEDMAIRPQAIYDGDSYTTFVTYQGPGLDPYVVAFDHTTRTWKGPVKIAENSLDLSRDMHGAPAMAIDNGGYIHVFYGAHNGTVRHLRSKQPRSIDEGWDYNTSGAPNLVGKYSYPQPSLDAATDAIYLFVRKDDFDNVTSDGDPAEPWLSGWRIHTLESGAASWETTPTPVLRDSETKRWYANAYRSAEGTTHVAAVGFNHWAIWMKPPGSSSPFYSRQGLYYLEVSPDGELYTVDGVRIVDAVADDPDLGSAEATMTTDYGADQAALETSSIASATVVEDGYGPVEYQNQAVVRVDPDTGEPGILFLSGPHADETTFIATEHQYTWKFARWDDAQRQWNVSTICTTDQFFDAGTFEFNGGDSITAYLTAEGYEPPVFHTSNRGGSIVRYDSDDGGQTWQKHGVDLRPASPVNGTRYNDPQLVVNGTDEARLLFCEWDNAGVNFVRKVFLGNAQNGAMLTKQVAPRFDRIAGNDRVQTSIKIAEEGYPLGSNWVVLASASSFPDALAGVPLAFAHDAPVLLVPDQGITEPLKQELKRLRIPSSTVADSGVIILGGSAAVTSTVEAQVKTALGWSSFVAGKKITRVYGVNRYETAKKIAEKLQERRAGLKPTAAVIASGESFPDALAVSPLAAVRGWPILLTPSDSLSGYATGYIASQGITTVHPVGGTAVVPAAADALPGAVRWWGANRYTTAKRIADEANGKGLYRERLVIASGETYPDALAGGMLAARQRATLGLVAPTLVNGGVNPGLALLATDSAKNGALHWYILGGERAVGPDVATYLSGYLENATP